MTSELFVEMEKKISCNVKGMETARGCLMHYIFIFVHRHVPSVNTM